MSLNNDRRWEAVLRKDKTQDGRFFFGVKTTGIFCRPGCPSRAPRRENVRFYSAAREAAADGLRPCLRCRPLDTADPAGARMAALCEYISAHSAERLDLKQLAAVAGLSPSHFQRSFRAVVGVSPREYLEACRMNQFKEHLRDGNRITDAVYEAGFGSSSRVYERAAAWLGMAPAAWRNGGKGVTILYACIETPVGLMLAAATERGLCAIEFADSEAEMFASLRRQFPAAKLEKMDGGPPMMRAWVDDLCAYLRGTLPRLELPLHVRATAFQAEVWAYLQSIPRGETRSYTEVAEALGRPRAARAVASACASNKVAIAIPCHRVVRGSGELGGYRWGLDRKRALLERERAGRE